MVPMMPVGDVAVMFEEIRSQFRVFGEALQGTREKIDKIEGDVVDLKRDMVEVKRDVAELKRDMVEVKRDLALVKVAVTEHSRELREIRAVVDKKVDRDEVEAIVERVTARTGG